VRRLLAPLALALLTAVPALGAPVVAIQDDQISNDPTAETVAYRVSQLASTGAKWTRVDIDWSYVAPARPANPDDPDDPAYDWSRYDTMLSALRDGGVSVMITVLGTPPWASASGKWNAAPRPADGGAFAGVAARRYSGSWPKKGGGVLPAVRSISPRNEPNIDLMTSPQCRRLANGRWVPASPKAYAALLRAAYPKIKLGNPKAIVVAGETAAGDNGGCRNASTTIGTFDFVKLLHAELGGGRRVPFDAWAQHMHPVGPPDRAAFFPSWRTLPQLTKLVNRMHRAGRMPIIISETSYATTYTAYHRYFVTEAQQAAYIDLTYKLAARQPQVEVVVYFNLQDHRAWSAGLFRDDWTAKPSLEVFRRRAISTPLPPKWASLP
jgi:hypothetical protein